LGAICSKDQRIRMISLAERQLSAGVRVAAKMAAQQVIIVMTLGIDHLSLDHTEVVVFCVLPEKSCCG
jgi:hypothetical protein